MVFSVGLLVGELEPLAALAFLGGLATPWAGIKKSSPFTTLQKFQGAHMHIVAMAA